MSGSERTTVPAEVVVLLRGALYAELGRACEDAPVLMPEAHSLAGWKDVLARIDGVRAALDAIVWDAPAEQQDTAVTLDAAMREALQADLDHWQWTAQAAHLESVEGRQQAASRAELIERFLSSTPRRPASLTLPPALAGCIAEGAEDLMHTIAQEIDNGEDLHGCARRLTAVARLLDAIGDQDTSAAVELDLAEHGETLRAAVAVMLPILERGAADTPDGDPRKGEREDELRLMRQLAAQVRHG